MTISGFIQSLFFAGILLVFINGEAGWLLVYILVSLLMVSVFLCGRSRNGYTVSVDEYSGMVASGDFCTVKIRLKRKGFCFSPRIKVSGEFCGQKFSANAALLFSSTAEVEVRLRAQGCGLCRMKLQKTTLYDFIGITCNSRNLDSYTAVAVLPAVVEYTGPMPTPSLLPSEDEDREEGATVNFGGTAGYEHRAYADGDSPRRINYKLSAKKQQFMVRLDESSGSEATKLIIMRNADSHCLEQVYALSEKLLIKNCPVTVYHLNESFSAVQPSSGEQLREWLAFRDLEADGAETAQPDGTVKVLFSQNGITLQGGM